ncbi:MAG TPA: 30S ribosomal protein S1, partial [Hydrogenobaculum sp.]|nr:30S ribosomal protein S1 [Hydrogenobaculum sp.]
MVTEFEELLKAQEEQLSAGSVVKGSVVKITDSNVYVDIGYKIEGVIKRYEVGDVEIGQEIEAVIVKLRGLENPILSTKPLKSSKGFSIAKKALEEKTPIEVTVESKGRPGFFVQLEDIKALMPFGEAPRHVNIGDKIKVLVTKATYENGKPMVNVSYKEYENIERHQKQLEFINSLEVGSTIEGKVIKVDPEKG